jgi:hypothetical protein
MPGISAGRLRVRCIAGATSIQYVQPYLAASPSSATIQGTTMRFHTFLVPGVPAFFCAFFAPFGGHSSFADDDHEHPEMVAGKADLLRQVPKKFATLVAVNAAERQVTLRRWKERKQTRRGTSTRTRS